MTTKRMINNIIEKKDFPEGEKKAVPFNEVLGALFEELEGAWDAYDRLTDTGFDRPGTHTSNARRRMNLAIKKLKESA